MVSSNYRIEWREHIIQNSTLALKQAVCYSCWGASSDLRRCGACKRVSYCSGECQKKDWDTEHKKICKILVELNKQNGYVPSTGRTWKDFCSEKMNELLTLDTYGGRARPELENWVRHEPYCYHCYRRNSQLEEGTRLESCESCLLTFFCPSCPHAHPTDCPVAQDIMFDERIMISLYRREHEMVNFNFLGSPKKQYLPLSSTATWSEYYAESSNKAGWKMTPDLRCNSNDERERAFFGRLRHVATMSSIPLTLLAGLEATMPDISARTSISVHIIGAAAAEYNSIPTLEEMLHHLPSLENLQISFVGYDVIEPSTSTGKTNQHGQHIIKCCAICTLRGRTISIDTWKGPYHSYVETELYKVPDLAAAFNSGFSVLPNERWQPTIAHLTRAPHPTLITAPNDYEMKQEMLIWSILGVQFMKLPMLNTWRHVIPDPMLFIWSKPNGFVYPNEWWYIVKKVD